MNQTRVELITTAFSPRDFPRESLPEVVIAGRSNVGKSSLINRLVGIKGLARISSTPGKTRSINFFRCNDVFFLVDLPGFGYAVGRDGRREWKKLVEEYFAGRSTVTLVVHLVDARIPPTALDVQFAAYLNQLELPHMVVATKTDKLSGNRRTVQLRTIREVFSEAPVILSSAVTGAGCKEVWKRVVEATQN